MGNEYPSGQEVRSLLRRRKLRANKVAKRAASTKPQGLSPSLIKTTSSWMLDNQAGLSLIAIVLILLTPICLGNSQLHTPDFYELSYYNAKTNQYATGQKDLCFVGFWIVLLTGMRAALMEYMLAPLAKRWGISTKKQQTRFAEQAWMIIYYNISWPIGLYLYYESQYFLNMEELWTNWPQREIDGPVKAYVLGQWAFWLHQVLVINIEQRRKDHWQMLSHHFVTIALIASSYAYHHTRVGHVIMISLDVVDLIFPLAKCFKYLGFEATCDVLFGLFVVVWLISRHVLLPMIIWSVYTSSPHLGATPCFSGAAELLQGPLSIPDDWDYLLDAFRNPVGVVCFTDNVRIGFLACLMILQVMMIVWSFSIIRVVMRVLQGYNAEDVRSDDEDGFEEVDPLVNTEKVGLPPGADMHIPANIRPIS